MATIFIRLTHSGVHADGRPNLNPVFISDLDTGMEFQHRKVPVYVPVGGSINIPASTRSMLSYETGVINGFVNAGVLTASLFTQPDAFPNTSRPDASTYPKGTMIWNDDDDAPNWSDGSGTWRDAEGNIT
jgi:hypothetical protein